MVAWLTGRIGSRNELEAWKISWPFSTTRFSQPQKVGRPPAPQGQASSRQATSGSSPSNNFNLAEEDVKAAELETAISKLSSSGMITEDGTGGVDPFGSMAPMSDFMNDPAPGMGMSSEDSAATAQLETLDRIMERATLLQYPELVEDEMRSKSAADAKTLYPRSRGTFRGR